MTKPPELAIDPARLQAGRGADPLAPSAPAPLLPDPAASLPSSRRLPLKISRSARTGLLFLVLAVAAVAIGAVSAGIGQLDIPPDQVLGALLHPIHLDLFALPTAPEGYDTLWYVRFPRVVMALVVGAALAAAGAVMQGVFGNPLAEPGVIGVSSGAALAASAVIVLQINTLGQWTLAVGAFVGGVLTTLLVYRVSRAAGRTEVVTLVLTGVAVNAFCGAGLAFLTFFGDTQSREEIVFWQLGSLNGTRWPEVLVVVIAVAIGLIPTLWLSQRLDLLSLGDRGADHLGVRVERVRLVAVVAVALMTSAAVAFCGIIAFVGLVIPHLIRILVGPAHAVLVPASALAGGVLLETADLGARTLVPYADLPIGMLTALVGGPFFFVLLLRARRRAGGWG